jgi:hypothetical protein
MRETTYGTRIDSAERIIMWFNVLNHRFKTILSALYAITDRDEYRVLTTCGIDKLKTKRWGYEWSSVEILNK